MEKYIVGVVLMDKNGKIYRWCYFDVKILTTFCIDFVLMIQNVRGKNCIGVVVWPWDLTAIQCLTLPNMPALPIFQRVLACERVGAIPAGFIHEGNLLDPHWHGMPKVVIIVLLYKLTIMKIFVSAVRS